MAMGHCTVCDRFFGREREAHGICSSCGVAYCSEHGLDGEDGAGLCLFCAEQFGSRFDALEEEVT